MRGGKEREMREESSRQIVFRIGFRLHSNTEWERSEKVRPAHAEENIIFPKITEIDYFSLF